MSKRKTTAEFIEELNKVNPNIEVLGEYVTNKTKILCKCKVDGNEWKVTPSDLLSGCGCPICGRIRIGNSRRKTNEDFLKRLYEVTTSVTPLEDYIDASTKILCKCNVCNNEWEIKPNHLLNGHGCPICGRAKSDTKRRVTNEEFVNRVSQVNPNITIKSKYTIAKEKVECQCNICNNVWSATPNHLLQGKGCPNCKGDRISKSKLWSHDEFISRLGETTVLIQGMYRGYDERISCKCKVCNYTWETTPDSLLQGHRCPQCYRLSRTNVNLTEEERIASRCYPEYTQFTNNVLKRDDFTCQLTLNSGNVVVHHLDGYNWCVEKRTDINNGITLSEDMHKEFHRKYGRGNNTKQQFVEFVNNLYTENKITRNAYEWVMSERL